MRRLFLAGLALAGCLLPEVELVDGFGSGTAGGSAGAPTAGASVGNSSTGGAQSGGGTSMGPEGGAGAAAESGGVASHAGDGTSSSGAAGAAGAAGYDGPITEFPTPTADATPIGICVGPDGNLWFTQESLGLARLTTDGVITEFPVAPEVRHAYWSITAGPDDELWFTDVFEGKVRHMSLAGVVTEAKEPGYAPPFNWPHYITVGPDDNLWLTSAFISDGEIYKLVPPYGFTSYPVPDYAFGEVGPLEIVTGPSGNDLWFAGGTTGEVGRITTEGQITLYPLPAQPSRPSKIVVGPDDNLWFADELDRVGKITTAGIITLYPMPAGSYPHYITAGPDNALWVTLLGSNQIARVSTTGSVTLYEIPTRTAEPYAIVTGPDGNIWFTERGSSQIGKLTL